ncbi:MAG: hypothetical protein ABL930_05385 [Pseudobdellovibrio sp.]
MILLNNMLSQETEYKEIPKGRIKQPALNNEPIDLFKRDNFFIDDHLSFQSGSQKRSGIKLALWSWMSASIDALILISISCFGIILFSILMKTQMRDILQISNVESNIIRLFMVSFLFSFWAYLVVMRLFMGASVGEWSCHLRLGQPVQRIKSSYVLRVIARTTLMLLTGVVVIPIVSLILKRDIAGDLTGLRIYSLT